MSPQVGLCGFFFRTNLSGGSLLSRSQSFRRYCCLASVLEISLCFSSLSLMKKKQNDHSNHCDLLVLFLKSFIQGSKITIFTFWKHVTDLTSESINRSTRSSYNNLIWLHPDKEHTNRAHKLKINKNYTNHSSGCSHVFLTDNARWD